MGIIFDVDEVSVKPLRLMLHVPPIVWKGDRLGHIGENDTFFYVIEGACFLNVDGQSSIVHAGQLAFLPRGKWRAYTHVSERFVMYEMAFLASVNGIDMMDALGLRERDFVVDIEDRDAMRLYFESSSRGELRKNPIYDIGWCSNILAIIREFAAAWQTRNIGDAALFAPVIAFMEENLSRPIKNEELAALLYMQTTYFIRRFGNVYGLPPQNYLTKMRMNRAMELLASTAEPIEKIAKSVGIPDTSYFSRIFKKHSGITPSGYRAVFRE